MPSTIVASSPEANAHAAVAPQINGVALNPAGAIVTPEDLRQRACSELLRQAAIAEGLLPASDAPATDGMLSEAASLAIEALLEKVLAIPDASDGECQRHYQAHRAGYAGGERVRARHILFAVTPGVDVAALRKRAEKALLDVRCHDGSGADKFARAASTESNCPSGAAGGDLGWLTVADCAPEFAKELFGHTEVGVLPRLAHSRFGFHVVEVLQREAGVEQPFVAVRGAVIMAMRQKTYITALRQYLRQLAGAAQIVGVDIDAESTPLVQ